jgi:hypothetical protein
MIDTLGTHQAGLSDQALTGGADDQAVCRSSIIL